MYEIKPELVLWTMANNNHDRVILTFFFICLFWFTSSSDFCNFHFIFLFLFFLVSGLVLVWFGSNLPQHFGLEFFLFRMEVHQKKNRKRIIEKKVAHCTMDHCWIRSVWFLFLFRYFFLVFGFWFQ